MSRFASASIVFCVALTMQLSACGGGGGDSSSDSPPRSTRAEVETVTKRGAVSLELFSQMPRELVSSLGGYLQGFSSDSAGSRTLNGSCVLNGAGIGSFTATVTKSAVRTGLAAGDAVALVFSNCDAGGVGLLLDGPVTLIASTTLANLPANDFEAAFQAQMRSLRASRNSLTTTHDGTVDMVSGVQGGSVFSTRFTVASSQEYAFVIPGVGYGFKPTATFSATETLTAAGSSLSLRLDGPVGVSVPPDSDDLAFTTPGPVVGPIRSGRFSAESGSLTTAVASRRVRATVGFNGASASVSADTNDDGAADITFDTSWAALVTP
jgi:hypothetical protein